ncbi:MAG: hypothetical protein KIT14_06855 [bacterium]|nr:hypothetical protein [bacterium]
MEGSAVVPARTPRELRRFGVSVGGVFGLLALISWWRGHTVPPMVLGALCMGLVVPGLVAPAVLGPVERRWMRFAEVLGRINARIILSVFWVLVMTPVGLVRRLFGDPLDRSMRSGQTSVWVRRPVEPVDVDRYRQQF